MTAGMRRTSAYVHFPWCRKKCPYCDFVSYKADDRDIPHEIYLRGVERELRLRASGLENRVLSSVFLGGGTPSLWSPDAVKSLLELVRAAFSSSVDDLEITMECNPSSLDLERLMRFRAAGVNRFSIGVQSVRNRHLQFLGRLHDRDRALQAVREAMVAAPRVNADLMFGMPGQTVNELLEDIDRILGTGIRHISAYALTIEEGTQFGELARRGKLETATDDRYADLFEALRARLRDAGFEHYEVSNYAHPGEESRHNQHYWRGGDYLGLGTGAVGCLSARRYRNQPTPEKYLAAATLEELEETSEPLDAETVVREAFMLGLRTREGIDLGSTAERTGLDPLRGRAQILEQLLAHEKIERTRRGLRVPAAKWLHLDSIVVDLF